jgi:2-haloacid dehalogenase
MLGGMPRAPRVLVLDVNETLSDLSGMAERFVAVGAPPEIAALWFAGVLRDGFALAAAGADARFGDLARDVLTDLLRGERLKVPSGDAVETLVAGFGELDLHPDVEDGLRALAAVGPRMVTLTNGSASVTERLLTRSGTRSLVEQVLSVEDATRWKPAPESYAYALRICGVGADDAMLVAAHPWDVDGAARAGMRTAWVNRSGRTYPSAFRPPEVTVGSLTELARRLTGSPA